MTRHVLITAAGSIARRHAHNLREQQPQARISVVTRAPVQRLADWPPGVQAVASFDEGMAAAPDAVMICSVSSAHGPELFATLAAGLPAFVEKPLLTSPVELAQLEASLARVHPACAVGCNLRFLPSLQRLRAALQQGVIGNLARAHLEVGQWLPDWRPGRPVQESYSADAARGGGVVFDLVHEIDAALWLLGDLDLAAAVGGNFSNLALRAPDTTVALLRTSSGSPVTVSLDYVSRQPVRRYVFVGDAGTLLWDLQLGRLRLVRPDGEQELAGAPADFALAQTYKAELGEWLAAIVRGAAPATSALGSGVHTARLMLAIAKAAA